MSTLPNNTEPRIRKYSMIIFKANREYKELFLQRALGVEGGEEWNGKHQAGPPEKKSFAITKKNAIIRIAI